MTAFDRDILALDLATRTGFCRGKVGAPRPIISHVDLTAAKNRGYGALGSSFTGWLYDQIELEKPSLITFEAPLPFHSGIAAGRIALGLAMLVEEVCFRMEVPVRECGVAWVRKTALGSGRQTKEQVMDWANKQNWDPPSHDAADAAALWVATCMVLERRAEWTR